MKRKPRSALADYRRRMARTGKVRLEVTVHREDAPLIRDLAKALNNPAQAPATRARLRGPNKYQGMTFKEFLAAIPLDRIELEREQGFDRDVDLWDT